MTLLSDYRSIVLSCLTAFFCFDIFLTSLIKLILWLKFFHRQKTDVGHGVYGPKDCALFQHYFFFLFPFMYGITFMDNRYHTHLLSLSFRSISELSLQQRIQLIISTIPVTQW